MNTDNAILQINRFSVSI